MKLMELERLAFGGEEFQYDTLSGLGSRFALGNRDIAHVKAVVTDTALRPVAGSIPVAAQSESQAIQIEVSLQLRCEHSYKR